MRAFGRQVAATAASLVTLALTATAQQAGPPKTEAEDPITIERYISPPDAIAKLVGAPRSSNYTWGNPSPTRKWLLHPLTEEPTLEYMGKKFHNLAGWQVDFAGNRARAMTTRHTSGYELLDWAASKTIKVELPPNARGSTFTSWSPDGMTFAYYALLPDATHIYLSDPATGKSRPLTRTSVLATNVSNFEWTADGKSIVTVLVPDGRGPEPKEPAVATEPKIRVNEQNRLRTRTFFDLLEWPHEKKLFEYYNNGQLALIDVKTRAVTKVGEPGMIRSIDPSPDGKYFRVTYLDHPFSYVLQTNSFGTHDVIIDATGKVLKLLAKREMTEGTSTDIDPADQPQRGAGGGGRGGAANPNADSTKRNLAWHPFESGLVFFRSGRIDSTTRARRTFVADSTAKARAAAGGNAQAGRGGGGDGGGGGGGRANAAATPAADSAAARPDTMFLWQPPFGSTATPEFKPLYVTPGNGTINSVQYSENGRIMFISQTVAGTSTTDAIYLDENNAKFTVIRGGGGGGGDGGRGGRAGGGGGGRGGAPAGGGSSLLTKTGNRGQPVVLMSSDAKFVYTTQAAPGAGRGAGGRGAQADSNAGPTQPFIDRIEIKTGARSRVYQASTTDRTEAGLTPLNDDFTKAITTRQSRTQPSESFLVDVATKQATQLTKATDYWPNITNAIRREVAARRSDGLPIRVRLTLPPDYKPGTRMPALFWFYPSEYDNQEAYASTIPDSLGGTGGRGGGGGRGGAAGAGPGTFSQPGQRTMAFITAAGYILVEPDAPIVATEGKLPNDNYVRDLRNGLLAVINALDTLKYIDRNKLAIGGHSYGGFSTMNALVHTDFFKAGIAGDGMYNRTLTPLGFQRESRDIWQGRETYLDMSPFLYADQLTGAILMYHSLEDQNVGTNPISATRMYHALMGLGKTAALYMYPYEDHGPAARESNLDQWARWVAWLDKYVKNPAVKPAAQ